ncbi:hypothetical protein BC332_14997 [Capsicum chinense]|nr:hypothetical protein BC332_14997 [Capsicum chinense]
MGKQSKEEGAEVQRHNLQSISRFQSQQSELELQSGDGAKATVTGDGAASILFSKPVDSPSSYFLSSAFNNLDPSQNSLSFFPQFACSNMLLMPQATDGFRSIGFGVNSGNESVGNSLILNRSKLLKPLDNFASIGEQPTLFQKRVVLRKNLKNTSGNLRVLGTEIGQSSSNKEVHEVSERKTKFSNSDDLDDLSVSVSTLIQTI